MSAWWGRMIAELRAERRLSQRKLSRLARCNRSTLRRIEAGVARGDIEIVEKILSVLGYELEIICRSGAAARTRRQVQGAEEATGLQRLKLLLLAKAAPRRD